LSMARIFGSLESILSLLHPQQMAAVPGCWVVVAALLTVLPGCSLVSLKSPEKPLSTRDLNARVLTHDFSGRFVAAVEQAADEIAAGTDNPTVQRNTLRWKIAASSASRRAASQIAPMPSLLDTWALTIQMNEFLDGGSGKSVFGAGQPNAVAVSASLVQEAREIVRRVTGTREFEHDRQLVEDFARLHPIASLDFARVSILDRWMPDGDGKTRLVDSLGTVPEAMAEAGDVLRMYGDTAPSQMLWRAQLAAQESGVNKDMQTALKRLDERLARLSDMADATPELVHGVVRDVRGQLDASWREMMNTIHTESVALSARVGTERQAAMSAVDAERAAVAADAAGIAHQAVIDAGNEIRRLVREALLLVIVLAIVILGLPFAAGYFVGRAQHLNR
jgi:hypothetical protein